MRSLPFVLITEGTSPQPRGLRVSSGSPLAFFGLTTSNSIVSLGSVANGCIDFTGTDTLVAIYYEFEKCAMPHPLIELILSHGVNI